MSSSLDDVGRIFSKIVKEESDIDLSVGVSIPLPPEYRDKYKRLQKISRRRFVKIAREVLMQTIDKAELQAS